MSWEFLQSKESGYKSRLLAKSPLNVDKALFGIPNEVQRAIDNLGKQALGRRSCSNLTCPIPPEAPATTACGEMISAEAASRDRAQRTGFDHGCG